MRSIGLSAYATTSAATARAYQGVRGSLTAKYNAMVSVFRARARDLSRSSMAWECKFNGGALGVRLLPGWAGHYRAAWGSNVVPLCNIPHRPHRISFSKLVLHRRSRTDGLPETQ